MASERANREIVVSPFPDSKLGLEIIKAEKAMGSVEFFVILAVAALHFAVVSRCIWADEFVADTKALKLFFKERRLGASFLEQTVGEFAAVVRLDTLDGKGEFFDHMAQENSGGIGAVFLEGL